MQEATCERTSRNVTVSSELKNNFKWMEANLEESKYKILTPCPPY